MEPAAPAPLTNLYNLFAQFSAAPLNASIQPYQAKFMGIVTPVDQAFVAEVFNKCAQAKTTTWGSGSTNLDELRQICRQNNLRGHFQLISFVAFSALFAGKCTGLQITGLAEELIANAVESSECLPISLFERLNGPIGELLIRSVISVLSNYSNYSQLENPQKGFWDIFTVCRMGFQLKIQWNVQLHAFLQFPKAYWDLLNSVELTKLKQWVNQEKDDLQIRRSLEGFRHIPIALTDKPEVWNERLAFIREVGCLYMLGLHLELWKPGIEKVFPGYLSNLCVAASAYAGANKNVTSQLSFMTRLIECGDPQSQEYKVLYAVYSYFLCISRPKLPLETVQIYNFLINYSLIEEQFPRVALSKLHQVAEEAVQELRKIEIKAGIGRGAFLREFFSHPLPSQAEVSMVLIHFGPVLLRELPGCSFEQKENVAQAFLAFLQDHSNHPVIPFMISAFTPDIPCYPQLLCKRIALSQATSEFKEQLLDEAKKIYRQMRFNPQNTINPVTLRKNSAALKDLFDAEKKEQPRGKVRRKK